MDIGARLKALKQAVSEKVWPAIFKEKFGKPGDDFRNGDEAYYKLLELGLGTDAIIEKMAEAPTKFIPRQNVVKAFFCGESQEWVRQSNGGPDKLVVHNYKLPTPAERAQAAEALWPTVETTLQEIMDRYSEGVSMGFWIRADQNQSRTAEQEEDINNSRRATDIMHCAVSIILGCKPPVADELAMRKWLETVDDLRGWLETSFQNLPMHLVNRFPKQEGGQLVSDGYPVARQHNNGRLNMENGSGRSHNKTKSAPVPATDETPAGPLRDMSSQLASVIQAPASETVTQ